MDYKVLLFEDDEALNYIYKRQLELGGLSTDAYLTGSGGLNALQTNNYSIILLDIMLPDINGLDILKQIKENDQKKHIPVILLTNLATENIIKEGYSRGANGYLLKASYTPDQIVEEVKKILQGVAQ